MLHSLSGSVRTFLAAALVMGACGVAEPLEDRLVGIIDEEEGVPVVSVPAEVGVGQEFEVAVTTVGGACVRMGETEVELAGATATVTPYDHFAIPRPGLGCLPTAETFRHTVGVVFPEAGDASVVVRVREMGSIEAMDLHYPVSVLP